MIVLQTVGRAFARVVTVAAFGLALFIAVDTLRAIVSLWSPLPWFDEWATVNLISAWQKGDMTAAQVLFSQHNEHRILVPRLVFFIDDWLFDGRGYLNLTAIVAVQFLHAALFALVLTHARPARAGRLAIAAVILALMFSLRQAENFSSGFQLQFVAVFAGATLTFLLFGLSVARERRGQPGSGSLLASLTAALFTTFTMSNGLIVVYIVAFLALVAKLSTRTIIACAVFALILTAVYFHGYEPVAHHSRPSESLRHPLRFLLYMAAYIGSIAAADSTDPSIRLGLVGMVATAWVAVRTVKRGEVSPGPLAMLGVMLFVGATAAVTAAGRLDFGIGQALSSRYVTGSATFWAAQLTYWWINPPAWRLRPGVHAVPVGVLGRAVVSCAAALLIAAMIRDQDHEKPQLVLQSFAQKHAADALMLGLYDPDAMMHTSWMKGDRADGLALVNVLRNNKLSIFSTADAASVGGPLVVRGTPSASCGGVISLAVADPALGHEGVRVSGRGATGARRLRRVMLVDAAGRVTGFGSGTIPGAAREEWQGYAIAPVGASIIAYGLIDGERLCQIGDAIVAPSDNGSSYLSSKDGTGRITDTGD